MNTLGPGRLHAGGQSGLRPAEGPTSRRGPDPNQLPAALSELTGPTSGAVSLPCTSPVPACVRSPSRTRTCASACAALNTGLYGKPSPACTPTPPRPLRNSAEPARSARSSPAAVHRNPRPGTPLRAGTSRAATRSGPTASPIARARNSTSPLPHPADLAVITVRASTV